MMRRIELLPTTHLQRRRQRRNLGLIVVAGMALLVAVLAYWMVLGMRVTSARAELAQVQSRNEALQAEINSLQRFARLEQEVQAKSGALASAMSGDVDWPAVLTEVAMVVPGEIWFTNLTASAGLNEGAAQVGTETAPVRISEDQAFGRIQFQGRSLSMSGVAKWLIRQRTVKEFSALWLNNATETEIGTTDVVDFDTTLELNHRAASNRYQEEVP